MEPTGRYDSSYRRWPTGLLHTDKLNSHFLPARAPNFGFRSKKRSVDEDVARERDNYCLESSRLITLLSDRSPHLRLRNNYWAFTRVTLGINRLNIPEKHSHLRYILIYQIRV